MDDEPLNGDEDHEVVALLAGAAQHPQRPPDISAIRHRARRRARARTALAVSAVVVTFAGVAGAVTRSDSDSETVTAAQPEETMTSETTSSPRDATTTAPTPVPASTTPETVTGAPTTAAPTTAAPPAPAPSTTEARPDGEVVADLPHSRATGERSAEGYVYDLAFYADSKSRCAWATDASTGQVYSVAWSEGSTVRFIVEDGVEQPAELRDETGRVVAQAGERRQLIGGAPWDAELTHCDVNGDGPDIGPLFWEQVSQ